MTVAPQQIFNGGQKHLVHFLVPYEQMFLKAALPWVPLWISTTHLTLMTIGWSIGIVVTGYFSNGNIQWLWLFNGFILLQYVTDMLDGEVGRVRQSGLVKWGFYMDHFLDYIFLCAIIAGYSFLLPETYNFLTLLFLSIMAGFMVHAFIDFSITNDFKISCSRFGVSEMRLLLILFNVSLIFFGKVLLVAVFPLVVLISFLGLLSLVYFSQKMYQHLDAKWQAQEEAVRQ